MTLPLRTKTLSYGIPSHNCFCQIEIPSLDLTREQIRGNELHVLIRETGFPIPGKDCTIRYNDLFLLSFP